MTEHGKQIEELCLMRWQPKYHGEVANPGAPGGKVDMWILVDSDTGDGIVSLGVPKGRSDIVGYVAAACGNPVRWVTDVADKRKLERDGVKDPEGVLKAESIEIANVLFAAYTGWMDKRGKGRCNGWTLNDALSQMWFAFCGQLPHQTRAHLLFRFIQLATTDYEPEAEPPSPTETNAT